MKRIIILGIVLFSCRNISAQLCVDSLGHIIPCMVGGDTLSLDGVIDWWSGHGGDIIMDEEPTADRTFNIESFTLHGMAISADGTAMNITVSDGTSSITYDITGDRIYIDGDL